MKKLNYVFFFFFKIISENISRYLLILYLYKTLSQRCTQADNTQEKKINSSNNYKVSIFYHSVTSWS